MAARLTTVIKAQGQMGLECDHCKTWITMQEPAFMMAEGGAMHWACALELYPHMANDPPCTLMGCNGVIPKDSKTCTECGYSYGVEHGNSR